MKVTGYRDNLVKLHDEIADLKSYFDGQKDSEEKFDESNLIRILGQ